MKSVHESTSEETIANEAWKLAGGQHDRVIGAYQIEMIRRNNIALRAFNASSDRWSKWLVALTVVLIVFSAVLVYLAWALLRRGG